MSLRMAGSKMPFSSAFLNHSCLRVLRKVFFSLISLAMSRPMCSWAASLVANSGASKSAALCLASTTRSFRRASCPFLMALASVRRISSGAWKKAPWPATE